MNNKMSKRFAVLFMALVMASYSLPGIAASADTDIDDNSDYEFVIHSEETEDAPKSTLVNTSTIDTYEVEPGGVITINASAEGGTGIYDFLCSCTGANGEEVFVEPVNDDLSVFEVAPEETGDYTIFVTAQDSGGDYSTITFNISVTMPNFALTNISTVDKSSIYCGESVTVNAAAFGGSGDYSYSYYFKKSDSDGWITKMKDTAESCVTIKPTAITDYDIRVVIRDSNGDKDEKIFRIKVSDTAELENHSTISAESIPLGGTVTVNAAAQGGSGTYTYTYSYKKSSENNWVRKGDTNTSLAQMDITPTEAVDYDIRVVVKDSLGKISDKVFTVSVNQMQNVSWVDREAITYGESATVHAAVQGGSGSCTYTYYFKKHSSSEWVRKGDTNTPEDTMTITPGAPEDYDVRVAAKDENGMIAAKVFQITVNEAPELINNASVESENVVLGDKIKVTAGAEGGTGSYKYVTYFRHESAQSWTTKGTDTTSEIKPSKTGV